MKSRSVIVARLDMFDEVSDGRRRFLLEEFELDRTFRRNQFDKR